MPVIPPDKFNWVAPPLTGLLTMNVAAPVSVTAPRVNPAVPLLTLLPPAIVRTLLPIDKAPRVFVTPAPAVILSVVICAVLLTVALRPKFRPVSSANCNSAPVPLRVRAVAVEFSPKAFAFPWARRMLPVLRVVIPV